jgi:hypothetical protein
MVLEGSKFGIVRKEFTVMFSQCRNDQELILIKLGYDGLGWWANHMLIMPTIPNEPATIKAII